MNPPGKKMSTQAQKKIFEKIVFLVENVSISRNQGG